MDSVISLMELNLSKQKEVVMPVEEEEREKTKPFTLFYLLGMDLYR